jgi:hypothetical protein
MNINPFDIKDQPTDQTPLMKKLATDLLCTMPEMAPGVVVLDAPGITHSLAKMEAHAAAGGEFLHAVLS